MENKHKNALIGGLLAIVFIMAVGFAGFTQRLTITETSGVTSNWNIGFSAATATPACTGNDTTKCGEVTTTSIDATAGSTKALTFNTKLFSPGDVVTYDVTVKNFGDVDAVLKTITMTPTATNNIKYAQSGLVENTTTVTAGQTKSFTVTVTFEQVAGAVAAQTNGLTLHLDWEQA
mgnify:CR=1 FL=1